MKNGRFVWLRRWFVIHFLLDVLVAIPLFIKPGLVLELIGIGDVSVVLARIVAAALMGIGVESFLGRKANREGYLGMLRLKIVWSSMAILGLGLGVASGEMSWWSGVGLIGVFLFFNLLWIYWFSELLRNT